MSCEVYNPISLFAVLLWVGFVCAISFMEAWLKFRAPGVTLELGLGIGRLVFKALNKMEWLFASIIIVDLLISGVNFVKITYLTFILSSVILILQTIWLLPDLNLRTELYLQIHNAPQSKVHLIYIIFEVIKVCSLIIFSILLLSNLSK